MRALIGLAFRWIAAGAGLGIVLGGMGLRPWLSSVPPAAHACVEVGQLLTTAGLAYTLERLRWLALGRTRLWSFGARLTALGVSAAAAGALASAVLNSASVEGASPATLAEVLQRSVLLAAFAACLPEAVRAARTQATWIVAVGWALPALVSGSLRTRNSTLPTELVGVVVPLAAAFLAVLVAAATLRSRSESE